MVEPRHYRHQHHRRSQTLELIEQKKQDGSTEKRSIFRVPYRAGPETSAIFPLSISYLETINRLNPPLREIAGAQCDFGSHERERELCAEESVLSDELRLISR